jgi:hypothetical protein
MLDWRDFSSDHGIVRDIQRRETFRGLTAV